MHKEHFSQSGGDKENSFIQKAQHKDKAEN